MEQTNYTSETHSTEKIGENGHTTKTTTTQSAKPAGSGAAVNALAIVGFIALVFIGIGIAIYGARYIPNAVSQLSLNSATSSPAALSVVSGGTTIPFGQDQMVATTTTVGDQHLPPTTMEASADSAVSSAPAATTVSAPAAPRLYGLPDLSTHIVATGYLANGSNGSFVPAQVIPAGARAATEFTVTNIGTNATGPWNFIAELPTANHYVFTSPVEQNLNPGDHILFTIGFDQANPQPGPQTVTVVADPNNQLSEISKENNTQSAAFEIAY